jgi:hypothetical protein
MTIAQAIERHKAAQAAFDAVPVSKDLCLAENKALDELIFTSCASDAEFLEKLRYLAAYVTLKHGRAHERGEFCCFALAVDLHFYPDGALPVQCQHGRSRTLLR